VNVKTKQQSKQWMHTHSPSKPKTLKQESTCQKTDGNSFLAQEGVMMVEFTQQGTTITAQLYFMRNTQKKLRSAVQKKKDVV
jgi:hypothetical protein